MAVFASLSLCLSLLAVSPQGEEPIGGDDPRLKPATNKRELAGLNKLAKAWINAELKFREDSSKRKRKDKAKRKFRTKFDKVNKKGQVLKCVGDLLAIFDAVFPYKSQSASGEPKAVSKKWGKDQLKYHLLAPRGYNHKMAYPSVLVLPGRDQKGGGWLDPKNYLVRMWKGTEFGKGALFLLPPMVTDDDYDAAADIRTQAGLKAEGKRIRFALQPFGAVQREFRLDRSRRFLDCGAGTAGFGLRLATYFPSLFAGLIIREPKDLGVLQLGSLTGMKILLVANESSKATCEEIKTKLDALAEGNVTIVPENAADPDQRVAAGTWMTKCSRPLFPSEVTIAPNHDSYHKAFWVEILGCEPMDTVSAKERPWVKVKADKETNKINISLNNVNEIALYLNDALVDLDKEVTILVNGKQVLVSKLHRSLKNLRKEMEKRFDSTSVYTAFCRFVVPKEKKEKKAKKAKKEKRGDGDGGAGDKKADK